MNVTPKAETHAFHSSRNCNGSGVVMRSVTGLIVQFGSLRSTATILNGRQLVCRILPTGGELRSDSDSSKRLLGQRIIRSSADRRSFGSRPRGKRGRRVPSFGQTVAEARKRAGLTQKELAAKLKKDDGSPISPQYLNDIEHDRRGAPPDVLLRQLSKILEIDLDLLAYRAGRLPENLIDHRANSDQVVEAFRAFRRRIGKGG